MNLLLPFTGQLGHKDSSLIPPQSVKELSKSFTLKWSDWSIRLDRERTLCATAQLLELSENVNKSQWLNRILNSLWFWILSQYLRPTNASRPWLSKSWATKYQKNLTLRRLLWRISQCRICQCHLPQQQSRLRDILQQQLLRQSVCYGETICFKYSSYTYSSGSDNNVNEKAFGGAGRSNQSHYFHELGQALYLAAVQAVMHRLPQFIACTNVFTYMGNSLCRRLWSCHSKLTIGQ